MRKFRKHLCNHTKIAYQLNRASRVLFASRIWSEFLRLHAMKRKLCKNCDTNKYLRVKFAHFPRNYSYNLKYPTSRAFKHTIFTCFLPEKKTRHKLFQRKLSEQNFKMAKLHKMLVRKCIYCSFYFQNHSANKAVKFNNDETLEFANICSTN